jgi:hypothetical protein
MVSDSMSKAPSTETGTLAAPEAAHRVIDSGRSVPEVARELSIGEYSLSRWVR